MRCSERDPEELSEISKCPTEKLKDPTGPRMTDLLVSSRNPSGLSGVLLAWKRAAVEEGKEGALSFSKGLGPGTGPAGRDVFLPGTHPSSSR
jgi:hypothetical protein